MTVPIRYLGRLATAAVLTGLAVPLAVLPGGIPARAHTALRSTAPASGATVSQPVDAVTLTFTQPVKEQFTTVVVAAAGTAFGAGPARVSGARVTQPVTRLPAGPVTVAWRTVALDGFPVQGTFSFTAVPPGSSTVPPTSSTVPPTSSTVPPTSSTVPPTSSTGEPPRTGSAAARTEAVRTAGESRWPGPAALATVALVAAATLTFLTVRRRGRRGAS